MENINYLARDIILAMIQRRYFDDTPKNESGDKNEIRIVDIVSKFQKLIDELEKVSKNHYGTKKRSIIKSDFGL